MPETTPVFERDAVTLYEHGAGRTASTEQHDDWKVGREYVPKARLDEALAEIARLSASPSQPSGTDTREALAVETIASALHGFDELDDEAMPNERPIEDYQPAAEHVAGELVEAGLLASSPSQDREARFARVTVPISLLRQWEADRNALLHAIVEHRDSTERSEERDERLWAVLSSERVRATSEVARAAVSSPTGDRERRDRIAVMFAGPRPCECREGVSSWWCPQHGGKGRRDAWPRAEHFEAADRVIALFGTPPSSGDREREALTLLRRISDGTYWGDVAVKHARAFVGDGGEPDWAALSQDDYARLRRERLDAFVAEVRAAGWDVVARRERDLALLQRDEARDERDEARASAPTGGEAAGARFEVGDLVVIDPDSEAFEYGGDAPFGGWVTRVWSDSVNVKYLGRCEADPDERQDGAGWCWGWPEHEIAVTDLRPMTGRDLAELQQQHVDAMRATDAVVIAARALASPAPSDGREAREDGGDDAH